MLDVGQARLFVNGVRKGGSVMMGPGVGRSVLPIHIGASAKPGTKERETFDGIIDEVRISNSRRYIDDFTPEYRFEPDEHTMALYHFDEGTGDVLHDSSGNGHDGRIVGAKWVKGLGSDGPRTVTSNNSGQQEFGGGEVKLLHTLNGHKGAVHCIAFVPDGTQLVSGGSENDNTVRMWDTRTGEYIDTIIDWHDSLWAVDISPDGTELVVGGKGHNSELWDFETRRLKKTLVPCNEARFSPNGQYLALGSGGCVEIFHGPDWETMDSLSWPKAFGGATGTGRNVEFSADSARLAYCVTDWLDQTTSEWRSRIAVWSISESKYDCEFVTPVGESGWSSIALSPDLTTIASGGVGRTELRSVQTEQVIGVLRHDDSMCRHAYSPDGTILAGGSKDGWLYVWRVTDGECVAKLAAHDEDILDLRISQDSRLVATCSDDETIKIWDVSALTHREAEPAASLSPQPPLANADDPDRQAAEWILNRGGEVYVCLEGEEPKWRLGQFGFIGTWYWIKSVDQLPSERFALLGIYIREATPEDIRQIASCTRLECLKIFDTSVDPIFSGMKGLKCVDLYGSEVGDQGLATLVDAQNLVALGLSCAKVTNKGLCYLEQLKTLKTLSLYQTPISDAGLVHLAGLTNLECLLLDDTAISGAGLAHLGGCENLEYLTLAKITPTSGPKPFPLPQNLRVLDLENELIPDEDLKYLYPAQSLKMVNLQNTAVTAEGVAKLREALPDCEVRCDFDVHQPDAILNGWSFSKPVNLGPAVNSSEIDDGPTLSGDGLTLYFSSNRPREGDPSGLWTCTRPSLNDPFATPTRLDLSANDGDSFRSPAISRDGLTLFFEAGRLGDQAVSDLWMCTRKSTDEPFGEPTSLGPAVNSEYADKHPAISADGLTLLFCSGRPYRSEDILNRDIWMCRRKSTSDSFGEAVNLGPTVNSRYNDEHPAISPDGLTLLFSSQRLGGWGKCDLWMSTRKSLSDPFGEPVNLGPDVNSAGDEGNPEISPDGSTLLFRSDRPGGQGKTDLWMVQIHRPDGEAMPSGDPSGLEGKAEER